MAKSTPHFNDMIAARGGKGGTSVAGKGSKMPAPPKSMPKNSKGC